MIIPFYKIYCVRCGKVCFSHINSWWCDDCREKQFAKKDHPTEKGGAKHRQNEIIEMIKKLTGEETGGD